MSWEIFKIWTFLSPSGGVNYITERPAEDGLPEDIKIVDKDEGHNLPICISSDEEGEGEGENGIVDEGEGIPTLSSDDEGEDGFEALMVMMEDEDTDSEDSGYVSMYEDEEDSEDDEDDDVRRRSPPHPAVSSRKRFAGMATNVFPCSCWRSCHWSCCCSSAADRQVPAGTKGQKSHLPQP